MTLTRTIVVLLGLIAVALSTAMLRADATRQQFETSKLDREAEELLSQIHERELELARLRNPASLRQHLADQRIAEPEPKPKPKTNAKPTKLPPRRKTQ